MSSKRLTTITVRRQLYEKITEIAHFKKLTIAELIEEAFKVYEEKERPRLQVDSILRVLDISPTHSFQWPAFPATSLYDPYHVILMDPKVEEYRSTAWIRSEEYPKKVGYPQFRPLARTFLGDLKIKKMLILSPSVGNNEKVREWIRKWVVLKGVFEDLKIILGDDVFELFVVREEGILKGIDKKYYDMGIYGDLVVGYLQLSEKSDPKWYTWINAKEEIETAKDRFNELKEYQIAPEDYPI